MELDIIDLAALPTDRPYVFVRNWWRGRPNIMLVKRTGPETCVRLWSEAYDDVNDQAVMFYWLCSRVDSWPVWGAIAASQGEDVLTQHLQVHRRRDAYGKAALE